MRVKSLAEPSGVQKGDEWLSPEGHSSAWRRIWNGTAWVEDLKAAGFPATQLSPDNPDLSGVGTEEDTEETEDTEEEETSTEDSIDEQGMSTEISDSDRGEQGSGGKSESEPQQRGKRGKVRKGGKGK